jgi:hypothetical protein
LLPSSAKPEEGLTLKVRALQSSATSVAIYQSTRRNIIQDLKLQILTENGFMLYSLAMHSFHETKRE